MTYNPDQPRDNKGEWTASSASAALNTDGTKPYIALADVNPTSVERAKTIAALAEASAKELNYDPSKINVTDKEHVFTLNGKELKAAGTAILSDGRGIINLHANQIATNEDVPSVMAHEVMHQKFQTFVNDYLAEKALVEKDPLYANRDIGAKPVKFDPGNPVHAAQKAAGAVVFDDGMFREKPFMRGDGLLNAPYDEKYPTYQAFTKAHSVDARDFAKTDGVTDYSRKWWEAWHGQTASTSQAMHETLAEIARLKFEGNDVQHIVTKKNGLKTIRKTADPNWTKLYKAVEDHWKKRVKK